MARRVMLAVLLVVAVLTSKAVAWQEQKPPQIVYEPVPESERLEIDGRKNPEMIPQWDIWLAAFEIMSRASELPTEVLKQVSAEEASSIRDAARENSRNFLALQQRVLQLMPTLQTDEAKFVSRISPTVAAGFLAWDSHRISRIERSGVTVEHLRLPMPRRMRRRLRRSEQRGARLRRRSWRLRRSEMRRRYARRS